MNSTWLVGTLIAALITALGLVAVAALRFVKSNPDQRQQDTAAFVAVTTGQAELNEDLAEDRTRIRAELVAFRAWALAAIGTLRAFIRSNGLEPPDIGPEP